MGSGEARAEGVLPGKQEKTRVETHRRRKVEFIVERARATAVLERIEALGATGYTVVHDVSGKGRHGERGGADVVAVLGSVLIIVITTHEIADRLLAESGSLLAHTTGIVFASDVDVVRGEHF